MPDVLLNKQYKSYNRLSRYGVVPFAYNSLDKKYEYFTVKQLKTDTPYQTIIINQNDTLDSLALEFYGYPTYFWIIADFNNIIDPYKKLQPGNKINIPVLSSIEFKGD